MRSIPDEMLSIQCLFRYLYNIEKDNLFPGAVFFSPINKRTYTDNGLKIRYILNPVSVYILNLSNFVDTLIKDHTRENFQVRSHG